MLEFIPSEKAATKPSLVFIKSAIFGQLLRNFSKQQVNIIRSLRTSIDRSHRVFLIGLKREDDASWTVDTPCRLQPIRGLETPLVPKEKDEYPFA